MIKLPLTIFIINMLTTLLSVAHSDCNIDYGYSLLRQAEISFCNKDTNQAIKILESYIERFPSDGTTIVISKSLSRLYIANRNKESAIKLLENAIAIKPEKGY